MPNCLFLCSSPRLSASLPYIFFAIFISFLPASRSQAPHEPNHLVFVIEFNPPISTRYASDAQSRRIDRLLFDGLVERDSQMNLHRDLAES